MAITTSYDEYLKRATQEYDPTYNAKVNAINNALNSNVTALEGQKSGINSNYDNQAKEQNYQNTLNKNNFDAMNTERGLGRSSILTTGLAGMDDRNTQLLGQIQQARTSALGNIDSQKTALQTNANTDLTSLANDRQSVLATLIKGYQNEDIAKEERDRQYQLQLSQLRASQARASGGGSSSSSKAEQTSNVTNAWTRFYQEIDDGTGDNWLKENRTELLKLISNAEYQKMQAYLKDNDVAYQLKQNKTSAKQKVSGGGRMLQDLFND